MHNFYLNFNKANEKTRISFECKQNGKKYTLISKTKDFQLNKETLFKNEIIHFFNIDAVESTLFIYLEIDGKRIKSETSDKYCHKMHLKDTGIQNFKKEMNCFIIEDVELTIIIRIINKYKKFFRKRSQSFHQKIEETEKREKREKRSNDRKRTLQTQSLIIEPEMSLQDKIRFFSGELIINKPIEKKKILPGKLKIPLLFLKGIEAKNNNKETKEKNE